MNAMSNGAQNANDNTLVPPTGLVTKDPNNSDKTLFCLFSQNWLTMQSLITQLLALPITEGDFVSKYGEFADKAEIDKVVAAMKTISDLSEQFGDPTKLIAQLADDPTILQSDTAPTQIYTHIVWFATKLYHAATTYNQTLEAFITLLQNSKDPEKTLQELLVGPSGLQSVAESMLTLANNLVQALAKFNTDLNPAVTNMTTYTAKDSDFLQEVNQDIEAEKQAIDTYQQAADDAFKAWKDYTIAATTSSIGVLVLSCGFAWPVSAVLGGVLGDKAKKARDAYNDAREHVREAKAEKQQKVLLYHDLSALNTQMEPATTASQEFQKTLQQVAGVWSGISNSIAHIANNFKPSDFDDLSTLMQALKLDQATKDWQEIAAASKDYTENSLVSFTLSTFGDPLPDEDQPGTKAA